VFCTNRDNSDERRLKDDSETANLFNKALSSCSFVNEEKYPREVISRKAAKLERLKVCGFERLSPALWEFLEIADPRGVPHLLCGCILFLHIKPKMFLP
jgi:hypothetical protein